MKYQSLRGMKDILPDEALIWQKIEAICAKNFKLFNYQEIRTPLLETTDLFIRAVGSSTDIVSKEMYSFIDQGKRNITLRPEGTASIVRAGLENNLISAERVTKLYYFGPMFRYERPQAGRWRQFHQAGVEVFGTADPSSDAETIQLAVKIFQDLGLSDILVNLNSVGCRRCRPQFISAFRSYLKGNIIKMCGDCHRRYQHNPLRILDCKNEKCHSIIEGAPATIDYLCEECRKHFDGLVNILDKTGMKYKINKRLVRGLDYYTKTTYEIISDVLGSQNAVCGGGRYDNLVEDFGGPDRIGAVGFAIGLERLAEILKSEIRPDQIGTKSEQGLLLYVCPIGDAAKAVAINYLQRIREAGISADMDYQDKKLKNQLKDADRIGARFTLIIGENELQNNRVILKNMLTAEQIETSFEEALKRIML